MAKHVIIGLTKGYDIEVLRPFIRTLRATEYTGDVVFFYADTDEKTLAALGAYSTTLVPFETAFPYGITFSDTTWQSKEPLRHMAVHSLRYLLADLYLAEHGENYTHVMLSDTRDVIFQRDPFDAPLGELNFFLEREGVTLAQSRINAQWLRDGFGEQVLQQIGSSPIVCSGITIGSTASIRAYLQAFLDTVVEKNVPVDLRGMDQGIHNYLIHTGIVKGTLHKNSSGPVFTLSLEKTVSFRGGYVYNASGNIPNVVHQYDRHRRLARSYWSARLLIRDYYRLWCARIRRIVRMPTKNT